MRISIDIDGVLADFVGGAVSLANLELDMKLPRDYQPVDWDFSDAFTKTQFSALWKEIFAFPLFWYTLYPYRENLAALRDYLKETKDDVYYVTARKETDGMSGKRQSQYWLEDHGIKNWGSVIAVDKPEDKLALFKDLKIDSSIDDYGPTIEAVNKIPGHMGYLLSRSWNADKDYGPRVNTLQDYFRKLDMYGRS